ncbi:hypothetical protein KP509_1Z167100 [Ceratopteris richardii]|nr:hypothetical protein KP509_1Z167100 [Ceratopteris richardii]
MDELEGIDVSSLEPESEWDVFGKAGLVSLVGSGPSKNGYEFFITVDSIPELNGVHVVFGEVIQGMDVVYRINNATIHEMEPIDPVIITKSGLL